MSAKRLLLLMVTSISLASDAFAVVHCPEVAPEAVARFANKEIDQTFGPNSGNAVTEANVIIGRIEDPTNFVAIVGFGNSGAFAFRVKAHYDDILCVIDSVTPTSFRISKRISDLKH